MPSAHSNDDIFDSDLLLQPEEVYYDQGFDEGQAKSTREDFIEGKQLGIQTGFQRFLMVGALRQLTEYILGVLDEKREGDIVEVNDKQRSYSRLRKQLLEVLQMLDLFVDSQTGSVQVKNTAEQVSQFDKVFKQCRARVRSVCSLLGYKEMYQRIEKSCGVVGGEIPVSEITGGDENVW